MAHDCAITQRLKAKQRTMFRLAERDHGITHKIVHLETGMSLSAIGEYARGETAMSGPAIIKLANMEDFPAELLSLLLDGTNRHIADGEDDASCLDTLGDEADDIAREVRRARDPRSPGGTDITDQERVVILRKAEPLRRKAC